jgi:hypothetical protein
MAFTLLMVVFLFRHDSVASVSSVDTIMYHGKNEVDIMITEAIYIVRSCPLHPKNRLKKIRP